MRAPDFWADRRSLVSRLLTPASCLYAAAVRWRHMTTVPAKADIPVVCVGNLVAGGAGKTPIALAVAVHLAARPEFHGRVHFMTRGYGGKAAGPLRVDPSRQDYHDVGDEALLLASAAPTWVARDRVAGAEAARNAGASVLIMDDGLQNLSLRKDLSLLVIDGAFGFGNGRVIPAGPLREPASDGLARADGVVLLGEDECGMAERLHGRPVLRARLVPTEESAAHIASRRVFAFAGIGRPAKFFATLRALDCEIAGTREFPDHHPFTDKEVGELVALARRLDALPVTTAKDAMRLPPSRRAQVAVLDVTIAWEDAGTLDRLLTERLTRAS